MLPLLSRNTSRRWKRSHIDMNIDSLSNPATWPTKIMHSGVDSPPWVKCCLVAEISGSGFSEPKNKIKGLCTDLLISASQWKMVKSAACRQRGCSYWCVQGIIDHFCLNKLVKRAGIHRVMASALSSATLKSQWWCAWCPLFPYDTVTLFRIVLFFSLPAPLKCLFQIQKWMRLSRTASWHTGTAEQGTLSVVIQ